MSQPTRVASQDKISRQASTASVAQRISMTFKSHDSSTEPSRASAWGKIALFAFFVLTRAFHPMLIDVSKVDGKIRYARDTPVVMNKFLTIFIMNFIAFCWYGVDGIRMCWQPRCLKVFGLIGILYAFGDSLEMFSMSKFSGDVYQVLLQTKLLITAVMVWYMKGSLQTQLQWHVLWGMFLATSAFVLVDSGDHGGTSSKVGFGMLGVLMKVVVSCYCAVLSEKYLKAFDDLPVCAKLSGLSLTWTAASALVCVVTEPDVMFGGFFNGWTPAVWMVTTSFIIKTSATMYLLQILDSVQKNIGEALAVIVIYLAEVLLPSFGKAFEFGTFLIAVLVVVLVKTYLVAPKPAKPSEGNGEVGKAGDPGIMMAETAAFRVTSILRVQDKAAPLLQGYDTVACEVANTLPKGVFYGLVNGTYAVIARTNAERANACDLTPVIPDAAASDAIAAKGSLAILGKVRDTFNPNLWESDIHWAKQQFVSGAASFA